MKKLSILLFSPYYPPHVGGVEFYTKTLIEKLREAGHSVDLVTSTFSLDTTTLPSYIHALPMIEIVHNFPVPQFWKNEYREKIHTLNNTTYDVVIGQTRFFLTSFLAASYAKKRSIPYVHIEHGSSFVQSNNPLIKIAAWVYDHTFGKYTLSQSVQIIAISEAVAQFLKKLSPLYTPVVIYRGMDDYLLALPKGQATKLHEEPVLTNVGRLVTSKGIFDLLFALKQIDHLPWKCQIIGDGEDKALFLKTLTEQGLSKRISLLGPKRPDEIPDFLQSTDIFVHPSHSEGLPTAVLEAALSGIPIVASDAGGTREISQHIHLVPVKQIRALSSAIENVLQNLSSEKEKSITSSKEVQIRFSWERAVQKFEEVLYSTVKKKSL